MTLTVGEVLALPAVRAGDPRVHVGGPGLDRVVRWLHVSEVADVAGTLSGGELILSTGMSLRGPDADPAAYLESLRAAGAVGLVVELGQAVLALPAPLVRAARRSGFPLVELRRTVRFVALTEVVHARILHAQHERLRASQRVHEVFTALSVEGAPVREVLGRAAALCGHPVVLEDLAHHALAFAGDLPADDLLHDWEARSRLVPPSRTTTAPRDPAAPPATGASPGAGATDHDGGPEGWTTTPVGPTAQRWGRLVVPRRAGAGDVPTTMVLERAAEALTISRLIERDDLGVALRAQTGLLHDLLRARSADERVLRSRARALGLAVDGAYATVAVRPGAGSPQAALELVARACSRARLPSLAGEVRPGQVAVVLSCRSAGDEPAVVEAFSRALQLEQHHDGPTGPSSAPSSGSSSTPSSGSSPGSSSGSSSGPSTASSGLPTAAAGPPRTTLAAAAVAHDLAGVAGALEEAGHVAEVASALPHHDPARTYRSADLGARGLLWWMREDPRLQAYAEAQLRPLLARDAERGSRMLDLLRDYIAVDAVMSRLAERLHLSRPATYARVARLRALLGLDVADPEVRLSLHLAVLAHDQTTRPRP